MFQRILKYLELIGKVLYHVESENISPINNMWTFLFNCSCEQIKVKQINGVFVLVMRTGTETYETRTRHVSVLTG
jgi:hypothetical protein